MPSRWPTKIFVDAQEALDTLAQLTGRVWLCRGQDRARDCLDPSIDRDRKEMPRSQKLHLERQSINLFRSAARTFASPGEQEALRDDIVALMVLRHYGVPTRLLDWSTSPYIATCFAVGLKDKEDGELWAFDHEQYARMGKAQWTRWPETTVDGSGVPDRFDAKLTAFALDSPPDWFCCAFYPAGFPRQTAQRGAYSVTANFGVDHATAIAALLADDRTFRRYIIRAEDKPTLRTTLRDRHGLSWASLFPDSAGAAESVHELLFPKRRHCDSEAAA
jgi:hypothetical protein